MYTFFISLGYIHRDGIADETVTQGLIFEELSGCLPQRLHHLHSQQQRKEVSMAPRPQHHLLLSCLSESSHTSGHEVVSPCGWDLDFLMAKDAEHFFICSLAISVSFLKKCLFKCLILKSGFLIMFWCNLKIGEQGAKLWSPGLPFCMSGSSSRAGPVRSDVLWPGIVQRGPVSLRGQGNLPAHSPCHPLRTGSWLERCTWTDPPDPPITPLRRWRHGGPQR